MHDHSWGVSLVGLLVQSNKQCTDIMICSGETKIVSVIKMLLGNSITSEGFKHFKLRILKFQEESLFVHRTNKVCIYNKDDKKR